MHTRGAARLGQPWGQELAVAAAADREHALGRALGRLVKAAGVAVPTYSLAGRLVVSQSGWLLAEVPNSVVRGLFDALDEPGIELPLKDGKLRGHISVMSSSELLGLGGPSAISELGKRYKYQLGSIKTVEPRGWDAMGRVFFVEVQSPELKRLRASYGLTPLPKGDHEFHVTIACRRRGVLRNNDVSKAAGAALVALIAGGGITGNAKAAEAHPALARLREAKARSDARDYRRKHRIVDGLLDDRPDEFAVDQTVGGMVGLTHTPTSFRLHVPRSLLRGRVAVPEDV